MTPEQPPWRRWTRAAAACVVGTTAFGLVLRSSLPEWLLSSAYWSVLPIALPAMVLLSLGYRRQGAVSDAVTFTCTMVLFALPLAALWSQVGAHLNAIGGVVPFSDASLYYLDASRLVDGHLFTYSARRPLFSGLLAGLLSLTDVNLRLTQAILLWINAAAAFLLGRELRPRLGPVPAALAVVLVFLYARVDGGTGAMLTENLGLPLGVLGTAALWRGSVQGKLTTSVIGIALLTLGLMARAGAFLALPALIAAVAWSSGRERERFSSQRAVRAALALLLAVVMSGALAVGVARSLASPDADQTPFSNFSYSLYGLAAGGRGWQQVRVDHPDATEGAEIYGLAFDLIRSNPSLLAWGMVRMWGAYSPPSTYHAFAFAGRSIPVPALLYVLALAGFLACLRSTRDPARVLIAAGVVGHLASVPFVPPIDAGLRAYAATQPLLVVLVSIGLAALWPVVRSVTSATLAAADRSMAPPPAPVGPGAAAIAGLVLVGFATLAPLAVLARSTRPSPDPNVVCEAGDQRALVRFTAGAFLRIVPTRDGIRLPDIPQAAMQDDIRRIELRNDESRYVAGTVVAQVHDLPSGRLVLLVADDDLLPPPPALLQVCGHLAEDPGSRPYSVLVADTVVPQRR